MRKAIVALSLASLAAGAVSALPKEADAQTTTTVNALPQGTIGGGLLGAELVVMIQGVANVRPRWAYVVFPLIGMAGGAVGGYFLDAALDSCAPMCNSGQQGMTLVSTSMLVLGLGLVIPSIIVYSNATQFRPDESAAAQQEEPAGTQQEESGGGSGASGGASPESTGGRPAGSSPAPAGPTSRRRGPSTPDALVNFMPGRPMRLSLPALSLTPSYSLPEMLRYGLSAQSEWRVPLFSAVF